MDSNLYFFCFRNGFLCALGKFDLDTHQVETQTVYRSSLILINCPLSIVDVASSPRRLK